MKTAWRVLRAISYPTSPTVIRRLIAGEDVPWDERGMVQAEPGEVVRDVPAVSVPWLREQGYIEPAEEA